MLTDFWNDLRYAWRSLGRSPGFAVAAVVTIALGVGINTGVFTVLNGVLFRDLPAVNAQRLVSIEQTVVDGESVTDNGPRRFTIGEYNDYRDRARTLSGVLAHADPRETTLGGDAPRRVAGAIVSCNFFAVLETPPALGRGFATSDCEQASVPVVVLGHDLWTTAFGADRRILGRTVELNRNTFTVVGVAAEGTYGASPLNTAYFAPLSAEPLLWQGASRFEDEQAAWLYMVGRRADGIDASQVHAELGVIAAQRDRQQPGRATTLTVDRATPMTIPPFLRGVATGAAAVLMTAFGLILLIACANVANLLLARGTTRRREIAIRVSLGASHARVLRQLLTESLLISLLGGLLGSALALWSFQGLVALAIPTAIHPEIPALTLDLDLSPDFRVLWFALALTIGTGALFGLAPALRAAKPDLVAAIKQGAGSADGSARDGRLRNALVGAQVALGMTLMIATGLLLRGLQATYTVDPGFSYRDVAHLSFGTDSGPASLLDSRFLEEITALPGVEAAAYASQTPLGEAILATRVRLPGRTEAEARVAEVDAVTPGYFALLELPILRGRTFTSAESADAERDTGTRPALVTATTARNFWGDADPIDGTLLWGDTTLRVVGVVADAQLSSLGTIDPYYIFVPRRGGGELMVKSRGDFSATAAGIRALVSERDPSLAVQVLALEANVNYWRGLSGMVTTLGTGLGVLALVLAGVGIYGIVSYAVTRRYREIGIRVALGANASSVLGLILRRTMRPVVIGALIGVAGAAAMSRVLTAVLFGVSPGDPIGLGGAALVVLGIALAASILAARPAARTDPSVVLRAE